MYLPFELNEQNEELYQRYGLKVQKNFLHKGNIEKLNKALRGNNLTNDFNSIRGFCGEFLMRRALVYHMNFFLSKFGGRVNGRLITGRDEDILGNRDNLVVKIKNLEQVLLLRQDYDFEDDFGYRTLSEVDGLYLIEDSHKNKELIVLESKTGDDNFNSNHIIEDICEPLKDIFEVRNLGYLIFNFKEYIYQDYDVRKLNEKYKKVYYDLKDNNFDMGVIHFPFEIPNFFSFVKRVENSFRDEIRIEALWNKKKETILLPNNFGGEDEYMLVKKK